MYHFTVIAYLCLPLLIIS